jgi:hypothetical protein
VPYDGTDQPWRSWSGSCCRRGLGKSGGGGECEDSESRDANCVLHSGSLRVRDTLLPAARFLFFTEGSCRAQTDYPLGLGRLCEKSG